MQESNGELLVNLLGNKMTSLLPRRRGKPRREEMELPANIQRAFIARASGANWIQCAEVGETTTENLRKWRNHPDANDFLERQTQDALDQSHSKLIAAAPAAAQRLIDVINDENNRGYVVVQAVESLFRIIDRGITDRENAEQLKDIKESLNALEGGRVVDV